MARWSKALAGIAVLAALGASGCAEQRKENQPQAMQPDPELESLKSELARLQQQHAQQQARITDLERENGELKAAALSAGQPEPAPGWKSVPGGVMIALDGQVLFDSGKNTLTSAGRKTIDSVASTLRSKYADYDVYVFGHTDSQPIKYSKWKDNYELSCERSLTVVRYLAGKGIATKNLAACGWGEHRPVASNSSSAERAFNRRVEIFAMAPHGTKSEPPVAKSDAALP